MSSRGSSSFPQQTAKAWKGNASNRKASTGSRARARAGSKRKKNNKASVPAKKLQNAKTRKKANTRQTSKKRMTPQTFEVSDVSDNSDVDDWGGLSSSDDLFGSSDDDLFGSSSKKAMKAKTPMMSKTPATAKTAAVVEVSDNSSGSDSDELDESSSSSSARTPQVSNVRGSSEFVTPPAAPKKRSEAPAASATKEAAASAAKDEARLKAACASTSKEVNGLKDLIQKMDKSKEYEGTGMESELTRRAYRESVVAQLKHASARRTEAHRANAVFLGLKSAKAGVQKSLIQAKIAIRAAIKTNDAAKVHVRDLVMEFKEWVENVL